jgi:hypothetical protein
MVVGLPGEMTAYTTNEEYIEDKQSISAAMG